MRKLIAILAVFTVSGLPLQAAEPGADMAETLKNLPANRWVKLPARSEGGAEIAWVYDEANKVFIKYGGCTDDGKVPPWQLKGEKNFRDTPGYSNRLLAFDPAKGKWKELVAFDPTWPKDRPPNGCTRCIAYDPVRKVVWLWGGNASFGWGDYHELWKWDTAARTFTPANAQGKKQLIEALGPNTCTMACDAKRGLIVVTSGGHYNYAVYDIAKNAWSVHKQPEGLRAGGYDMLGWDPVSGKMLFLAKESTGRKQEQRPAPEQLAKGSWFKMKEKPEEWVEHRAVTWLYDPGTNQWARANPKTEPPPRWRYGLAYDSKNKVFIMVGGTGGTWDKDERFQNDTWIYDPAANTWTDPKPAVAPAFGPYDTRSWMQTAYDSEHQAVICWVDGRGSLWAYRYK